MAKNLIPQIAKMLGVELGEEFKINRYDDDVMAFKFTDNALMVNVSVKGVEWMAASVTLGDLLAGKLEIIKLPWKPRKADDYYTFSFGGLSEEWVVVKQQWDAHPYERALFDKGWVYRSEKEAQAALPKVTAEIGVEYKL